MGIIIIIQTVPANETAKEMIAKSGKANNANDTGYKILAGAKREFQSRSRSFKLKMTNSNKAEAMLLLNSHTIKTEALKLLKMMDVINLHVVCRNVLL